MALGGICGSLLGGYALTNLQIDRIFLLFSVLPTIQLLSCCLVKETPVGSKALQEFSNSSSSHPVNGNNHILDEDNFFEKSNITLSRRKQRQKNKTKRLVMTRKTQSPEKGNHLVLQWFHSLKTATYSLYSAFRQPLVLR